MAQPWLPAAGLCLASLLPALAFGAAPRGDGPAAAVFPPWWSAPRAIAAADAAGTVSGVGAYPFIVIASPRPDQDAPLARALRVQGAWLILDPGLAGPCTPPNAPDIAAS